jgi:hypothetical protein
LLEPYMILLIQYKTVQFYMACEHKNFSIASRDFGYIRGNSFHNVANADIP